MGLDMWLYARQYVSDWEFNDSNRKTKELNNILESVGWSRDEINDPFVHVDIPIMYWRKANAIHGWFINNCADGEDNCQSIRVSRETLVQLRDATKKVLSMRNDITAEEEAELYLPPTSGFFFGSTNIDEYYYQDLEHTLEGLNNILNKIPEEDHNTNFIYQASW